MTSVLQGGRRRRRRAAGLARLLFVLALLAAGGAFVYTDVVGKHTHHHAAVVPKAALRQPPARAPSTRSTPPDPAQAALAGVNAFHIKFKYPPREALVFDLGSGEVLWRRNPLQRVPIASLTKLMTALLAAESTRPTDLVRITKDALNYTGSGVGLLPKGRHVTVRALLYGLLLPSGNDAAIALADHIGGTRRGFVAMMNAKARELGLRCTHFASPSGIDDRDKSCAADLAVLARLVMARRQLAHIVRRTHAAIRFPIKGGKLWLNNTNPLLRMGYPGTIGLKTGDTAKAGHCLIAVVRRGARTMVAIVLHSPNPQQQVRSLLARAFSADI
jgi:D-alanyl-D-alanine carboxypeptidase (penicillin-binding protein 5/6)